MGGDDDLTPKEPTVPVAVEKLDDGSYKVTIDTKTVMLPKGSSFEEEDEQSEEGQGAKIGTSTVYLEIDPYRYSILYVNDGDEEVILSGDDDDMYDDRGKLVGLLYDAWKTRDTKKQGSSRLNRKAKRTKRNRRNLKRSKLRKLTTRRR